MAAADYAACEERVLVHEGSRYTDGVHPYDPGGPTRWGITINDERMAFLQGLAIWPTYRSGWTIRVREVRASSLELAATGKRTSTPTPIPSEGMGKGKVPEPTTAKQVNVAAGGGLLATVAGAGTWLGAHPAALAGLLFAVVVVVVVVHGLIMKRHQEQSEEPMPGTPVVPEKA